MKNTVILFRNKNRLEFDYDSEIVNVQHNTTRREVFKDFYEAKKGESRWNFNLRNLTAFKRHVKRKRWSTYGVAYLTVEEFEKCKIEALKIKENEKAKRLAIVKFKEDALEVKTLDDLSKLVESVKKYDFNKRRILWDVCYDEHDEHRSKLIRQFLIEVYNGKNN